MMLRCSTESGPASHSHSHNHAHPNTMQMAPFGNDNPGLHTPPSASSRDRESPGAPRYRRCAYLDSPTFQAFGDPADPANPAVLVRVDRSRFQGMVGHLQGRPRDQIDRLITDTSHHLRRRAPNRMPLLPPPPGLRRPSTHRPPPAPDRSTPPPLLPPLLRSMLRPYMCLSDSRSVSPSPPLLIEPCPASHRLHRQAPPDRRLPGSRPGPRACRRFDCCPRPPCC